ncbi:MAG: hypothetical protein ACT4PM_13730 [Gemmatimonadales bacterium]
MSDLGIALLPWFTVLGLGTILGAFFQARFQQRSKIQRLEHDLKQKRYLCILILMLTKLNPEIGLKRVHAIRPDLKSLMDVEQELQTELLNGVIYAGNEVLKTLARFLMEPDQSRYVEVANAMRGDLWGKKARVTEDFLELAGLFPDLKPAPLPPPARRRGVIHPGIQA